MPDDAPVRIGVIGAGGYMNTHMEAYRRLEGLEVVAFCRRNAEALGIVHATNFNQRGREPIRSTFGAGAKAAELVDAAYESANENRWATL